MINFSSIAEHVIALLKKELPLSLTYHDVDHTTDVVTECIIIAREEGITDLQTLQELQVAAIYHDTGFLYAYKGHEEKSIELARRELPHFNLPPNEIDNICRLINATKVPQLPENHVQQIICDADLDYLGRDDFFINTEKLHKEFIEYQVVSTEEEWERSRIAFLRAHSYFTRYEKARRDHKKLEHLQQLLQMDADLS
ncbi:MAG TPA: hypothetical protein VMY77_15445 [Chitinophagaceae bacterium]|nr:hypothetical protein [Chitinophagaceae bacterium]